MEWEDPEGKNKCEKWDKREESGERERRERREEEVAHSLAQLVSTPDQSHFTEDMDSID